MVIMNHILLMYFIIQNFDFLFYKLKTIFETILITLIFDLSLDDAVGEYCSNSPHGTYDLDINTSICPNMPSHHIIPPLQRRRRGFYCLPLSVCLCVRKKSSLSHLSHQLLIAGARNLLHYLFKCATSVSYGGYDIYTNQTSTTCQ